MLKDDMVQGGIEQVITNRVSAIPVAPLAGQIVDVAIEGDHHEVLIDATLVGLAKFLNDNRGPFRKRLNQESPWWVPEQLDDRIFEKIYDALNRFVDDVSTDRSHELRRQLDRSTRELAERLKSSPELLAKGEELKLELAGPPGGSRVVGVTLGRIKTGLIDATDSPHSELRQQIDSTLVDAGRSIVIDAPVIRAKVDRWIIDGTGYVAEQFRGEVAGLIATTVQGWDTPRRLPTGSNFRSVETCSSSGSTARSSGGLAGLAIYSASQFLV
ncbi:MAG: DUF445 family protein [Acidimicrobiales bacterium]